MMNESQLIDPIGIDLNNFDKEAEIAKYKDSIKMEGWHILVRLYIEAQKSESGMILPQQIQDEQKYETAVGLVVKIGNGAYFEDKYRTPWCSLGDWVVFPRQAGYRISLYKAPVWVIEDDRAHIVVNDPRIVTR